MMIRGMGSECIHSPIYEGEWKGKNKKHGRGTMRYANGDAYEGQYSDNFRHGREIFKYANGDVYDGQWENNKKMT